MLFYSTNFPFPLENKSNYSLVWGGTSNVRLNDLSKIYGHNPSNCYFKFSFQEIKLSLLSNYLMFPCKKLTCLKNAQCSLTHFKHTFPNLKPLRNSLPIILSSSPHEPGPSYHLVRPRAALAFIPLNGWALGYLSLHNQVCSIHTWTSAGTENTFFNSTQFPRTQTKRLQPF